MQLYFSPLACSMATRIALYEAGAEADYVRVDLKAKRLPDGGDFLALNPLGQVPVLRTDEGNVLTENGVILQHVAERHPAAGLAPAAGIERARLQQWLSFLGTEVHKGVFTPLLDPRANEGARQYGRDKAASRFGLLDRHLRDREFLLDRFSVADAYLVTMLNWCFVTDLRLADYPGLEAYYRRALERPSVRRANAEERALYAQEQAAKAPAAASLERARAGGGGLGAPPLFITGARPFRNAKAAARARRGGPGGRGRRGARSRPARRGGGPSARAPSRGSRGGRTRGRSTGRRGRSSA